MENNRRRWSAAAACMLVIGLSGCGYVSTYKSPRDGRARVVWRHNRPYLDLAGGRLSAACRSEIERKIQHMIDRSEIDWKRRGYTKRTPVKESGPFERALSTPLVRPSNWPWLVVDGSDTGPSIAEAPRIVSSDVSAIRDAPSGPWIPRYFHFGHPHFIGTTPPQFTPHAPPTFSPRLVDNVSIEAHSSSSPRTTSLPETLLGSPPSIGEASEFYSFWVIGSMLMYASTIFLPPLYILGLWWQQSRFLPLPETNVLNVVNIYNDLARTPGSPCAYEAFGGAH